MNTLKVCFIGVGSIAKRHICNLKEIYGNNVIIERDNRMWIYNYVTGKIVNNDYIKYRYLNNNLFVISDNSLPLFYFY